MVFPILTIKKPSEFRGLGDLWFAADRLSTGSDQLSLHQAGLIDSLLGGCRLGINFAECRAQCAGKFWIDIVFTD